MALSPTQSEEIRERIEDLDLNDPHDRQAYEDARYEYIGAGEGKRPEAYDDGRGNTTVGVGFDMDQPTSRQEWDDAFSKLPPDQRPDFDKVYSGDGKLSDEQMRTLFDHSVEKREQELEKQYGKTWDGMTPNEKLATEDAYYNGGGGLVGRGTNYHKEMTKHEEARREGRTEDSKRHLDKAIEEIKDKSNPKVGRDGKPIPENVREGIQNRRDSQAEMLNTYDRDLGKKPTPDNVVEAVRNKVDAEFERIKVTDQEARQTANEVSDQSRAEVSRQIKEKCGIEPNFEDEPYLQEEIEGFVREYKEAVGDMLEDARQDIDARIEEGRQAGETGSAMEKEIASQLERQQEIANRIGERLVHQFDARLTQLRQQAAGIKQYIWRTVGDERVRASHAAAEGQVFSWDGGGPHPGEEENCRCSAEPVCPE